MTTIETLMDSLKNCRKAISQTIRFSRQDDLLKSIEADIIKDIRNTKENKMTTYMYSQNNPGGFYTEPAHNIIVVDAKNETQALETAEKAGLYLHGVANGTDCNCCGDRWGDFPYEFDSADEAKAFANKYDHYEGTGFPLYLVTDDLDWD